jgi:hypothetical protein
MTAKEWLNGKTCGPKLISLEHGYVAPTPKDFVTSGRNDSTPTHAAPNVLMTEKEVFVMILKNSTKMHIMH